MDLGTTANTIRTKLMCIYDMPTTSTYQLKCARWVSITIPRGYEVSEVPVDEAEPSRSHAFTTRKPLHRAKNMSWNIS